MKELTDTALISTFRQKFEAGRCFELDDDMEFCPNLCTDEDVSSTSSFLHPISAHDVLKLAVTDSIDQYSSINSSSDRSSLSSGSPESSPTQQQTQPASFTLSSQTAAFNPSAFQQQQQLSAANNLKLHQPTAARIRNAIPIVNPSTGISVSNPSPTASPARIGRW